MLKTIAFLIALGACSGSKQSVQQPAPFAQQSAVPSCVAVSDRMTILRSREAHDPSKAELAAFNDIVTERCGADRWSDEARQCYGTANDDAAAERCLEHLTPEQNRTVKQALEAKRTAASARQDAMVHKFQEFVDQACRCQAGDAECAKTVSDDMTKWVEAQAPDASPMKPDPRLAELTKTLTECITKAMMPVEPPAAPPKGGGAKKKPADK